jgi:hypothetical protein
MRICGSESRAYGIGKNSSFVSDTFVSEFHIQIYSYQMITSHAKQVQFVNQLGVVAQHECPSDNIRYF